MLFLLAGCVHVPLATQHTPDEWTALAETYHSPPAARALLAYACTEGSLRACTIATGRWPDDPYGEEWEAEACRLGNGAFCMKALEHGVAPAAIAPEIVAGCRSGNAGACDLGRAQGWVQPMVADITRVEREWEPAEEPEGEAWTLRETLGTAILDGEHVELIDAEGVALRWPRTGRLEWLSVECGSGGITRDGRVAAVAMADAELRCRELQRIDLTTMRPVGERVLFDRPITRVGISDDGMRIAVALADRSVERVDLTTGTRERLPAPPATRTPPPSLLVLQQPEPGNHAVALAFSPTGALAVGWSRAPATYWAAEARRLPGAALHAAFFPDGRLVTLDETTITFYDANGRLLGTPIRVANAGDLSTPELALSPDGRAIAVESGYDTLVISLGGPPDVAALTAPLPSGDYVVRGPSQPPRRVAGTVQLPDGKPAVGIEMRATDGTTTFTARTDATGRYVLGPLPGGWWRIAADVPFSTRSCGGFQPRIGERHEACRLEPAADLDGRVVDAAGVPAAGVHVSARDESGGVITDAEGRFQLGGVRPGDELVLWAEDGRRGRARPDVTVGQRGVVTLKLASEAEIPRVRVVDDRGEPRAGCNVEAGYGWPRTDANGQWAGWGPRANARMGVSCPDGSVGEVSVVPGREVSVTLPRAARAEIRVVGGAVTSAFVGAGRDWEMCEEAGAMAVCAGLRPGAAVARLRLRGGRRLVVPLELRPGELTREDTSTALANPTLRGRVVQRAAGEVYGVAGAYVEARCDGYGEIDTRAGPDGKFVLELPAGCPTGVRVSARGYRDARVKLEPGKEAEIEVRPAS